MKFTYQVKMVFTSMRLAATGFAAGLTFALIAGCDSDKEPELQGLTTVEGHVFHPVRKPATDQNVAGLKVPDRFTVSKFAENLGKPRMLAVNAAGGVYFTDRDAGTVTLLTDTDADGKADSSRVVARKENMHGIAIDNNVLFLVTVHQVLSAPINGDGTLGALKTLIADLPDAGQHPNRTIGLGPDGKMYISVGSTCNACDEPNAENATILQANADGSGRRVFASGLRNTIGFGWHPETGKMYGMDHGIDWLGDEQQKEELNLIEEGNFYGWPYIYSDGRFNPQPPPQDSTYEQYRARTTAPLLEYQAHSAPLAMVFYTGSGFGSQYANDAFIAMRGSWNRRDPVGYKVVRLHFENDQPARFDDFLSGFLIENNTAHFARLAGLAVHPDGSLLVSDDTNGVIYRVSHNR